MSKALARRNGRTRSGIATLLLAGLCGQGTFADVSPPRAVDPPSEGPAIVISGEMEIIFDWTTDRCYDSQIPDLPVRAYRDNTDQINLILSHTAAHRMRGENFDNLTLDCDTIATSRENPSVTSHANYEWIAAIYTEDGQTVHALVHNEFQGNQIGGSVCPSGEYFQCWQNTVTYAVSTDGGASFMAASPPDHLVAASHDPYVPDAGIFGLFSPSNIIKRDGYYYAFLKAQVYPLGFQHVCLMRTNRLDDPDSWRFWNGRTFDGVFVDTYRDDPEIVKRTTDCTAIALPQIAQIYEGVTWNTHLGKYVMVGTSSDPSKDPDIHGIYYAVSDDLINWDKRQPLLEVRLPWRARGSERTYLYPTLIDHNSRSRNFETTGETAYLYLTRLNFGSGFLDRDLIRFPITFRHE